MIVTAWKANKTFGVKVQPIDRDQYFQKNWNCIFLFLGNDPIPVEINVNKASFWNETCHELINIKIGDWLKQQELVPWTKGKPPRLVLEPLGENRFQLTGKGND